MAKSRYDSYPLSDWLQYSMERNIGRAPIWKFPHIPDWKEDISFRKLNFQNQHHLLEMFENDEDEWVNERFKEAQSVYNYVAHLRIVALYSAKHGGCDWLVRKGDEYIGVLHAFDFSIENYNYHHRRCAIGYAFTKSVRGTGLPLQIVPYFQQFLFQKMNLLLQFALVNKANHRSIRFLEKLGFEEQIFEEDSKNRWFESYRSKKARAMVMKER
ncbi:MAG: GNAT family protein [Bacteroidota bacterium]